MTGRSASSQLSSLELFLMELLSFSKELLALVLKLTKQKHEAGYTSPLLRPRQSDNVSNVFRIHFAGQI